ANRRALPGTWNRCFTTSAETGEAFRRRSEPNWPPLGATTTLVTRSTSDLDWRQRASARKPQRATIEEGDTSCACGSAAMRSLHDHMYFSATIEKFSHLRSICRIIVSHARSICAAATLVDVSCSDARSAATAACLVWATRSSLSGSGANDTSIAAAAMV